MLERIAWVNDTVTVQNWVFLFFLWKTKIIQDVDKDSMQYLIFWSGFLFLSNFENSPAAFVISQIFSEIIIFTDYGAANKLNKFCQTSSVFWFRAIVVYIFFSFLKSECYRIFNLKKSVQVHLSFNQ